MTTRSSEDYRSITIRSQDSGRYAYLALLPTSSSMANDDLLLSNVPSRSTHLFLFTYSNAIGIYLGVLLSQRQLNRRQQVANTVEAHTILDTYDGTDEFSIHQQEAQALADRLHVDLSIILFNAQRLRSYCLYFLQLHERFRRKVLRSLRPSILPDAKHFTPIQMRDLLEFYLQIDGKEGDLDGGDKIDLRCDLLFSGSILFENMLLS